MWLSPDLRSAEPSRSSLIFLLASPPLEHYSILSLPTNLILSSLKSTPHPHHNLSSNVLPSRRKCLLSAFPFLGPALIHSLMVISIDLRVKYLKAWISTFLCTRTRSLAMQLLKNDFEDKMPLQHCSCTRVRPTLQQWSKSSTSGPALVILSRSVSCRQKMSSSAGVLLIHPLTLYFSTSPSLSKLYKCHFIMHLSLLWVCFHLSPPFCCPPRRSDTAQLSLFLSSLFYQINPSPPAVLLGSFPLFSFPH